jgi:LmbE family N-acetylglucosaminyl deacetylase
MTVIYLSPHLDDVVFSCGGWIWEQTQQGQEVEIWTICAGDPPQGSLSDLAAALHHNWQLGQEAVQARRQEDQWACMLLGASPRHFPFLDCIYRTNPASEPFYQTVEDLFGGLDPQETDLIGSVSERLAADLPGDAEVVAPLGIGNHVDHDMVRKAASRLNRPLKYYADYPYLRDREGQQIVRFLEESPDWRAQVLEISEQGMAKWVEAALQYGSQISSFWSDPAQLEGEIRQLWEISGGFMLWEALED